MNRTLDRAPRLSEALASLPNAVIAVRTARRLSLRQAADEMGMSFNTLARLEKGENCTLGHLVAAALWIEAPPQSDEVASAIQQKKAVDDGVEETP